MHYQAIAIKTGSGWVCLPTIYGNKSFNAQVHSCLFKVFYMFCGSSYLSKFLMENYYFRLLSRIITLYVVI